MPVQRLPRQVALGPTRAVRYRRLPVPDVSTGGVVTANQYTMFFEKIGPASYATGGFVIDLSATYSSLNSLEMLVKKGFRGVPGGRLRVRLNNPTAGKATIIVERNEFLQAATTSGGVANQPAGVTLQSASGALTSAEASHVHTLTHDHPATATSAATNTGAGVNSSLITLNQNPGSHTHTLDPPNFIGNTGAGSSHTHADNNIYQHGHTNTLTVTNVTVAELAAATNLSSTTWLAMASGVRI